MKVYLVYKEHEYESIEISKVYSTLEKAQAYVDKLNEYYKDDLLFQNKSLYFGIEELEVE